MIISEKMTEPENIFISHSESETLSLGEKIGKSLVGGELISLVGELGTGKSVLVRGIAKGMGIIGAIRSPSFNLMREYSGRLILRHWDLYRIDTGFSELGLIESTSSDSVTVVEWSERWDELKKLSTAIIYFNYADNDNERRISWSGKIPGMN